ncbi:hypothetical protein [Hyalangium gracile]|uniref:hypothetical protein n=1 Tax=Hyalangium gracile TaxID=394092 RepID=UPI001CCFD685|nr:hypothetical protein [Hyalangium gracile]
MKVDGPDHPAPARPTPAPGQFQRALQKAAAPPATSRPPTGSRLPGSPTPIKSPPRPSVPPQSSSPLPRSAAPLPVGTSRPPGTAFASAPVLATTRSAIASPENLGLARQAMHGEAGRLRAARTESQAATQEKTEHRLSELISRELTRPLRSEPAPAPAAHAPAPPPEASKASTPTEGIATSGASHLAGAGAGPAPSEAPNTQLKVQATLELIEKIELFVQAQRPALRMSLGSPLSATVEVERTGPREVALRIQGRHGPLAQEDLARIRDELGARGLRLRSLRAE